MHFQWTTYIIKNKFFLPPIIPVLSLFVCFLRKYNFVPVEPIKNLCLYLILLVVQILLSKTILIVFYRSVGFWQFGILKTCFLLSDCLCQKHWYKAFCAVPWHMVGAQWIVTLLNEGKRLPKPWVLERLRRALCSWEAEPRAQGLWLSPQLPREMLNSFPRMGKKMRVK